MYIERADDTRSEIKPVCFDAIKNVEAATIEASSSGVSLCVYNTLVSVKSYKVNKMVIYAGTDQYGLQISVKLSKLLYVVTAAWYTSRVNTTEFIVSKF